jgi:hypothetical protein
MGLRGTASIDYSIADKFVPSHRTFEYPFSVDGDLQKPSAQGPIQRGQPDLRLLPAVSASVRSPN